MTKVTQKEFETVEKEVEKYECEFCGAIRSEDEINTQMVFVGDRLGPFLADDVAAAEKSHVCEDCSGARQKVKRESLIRSAQRVVDSTVAIVLSFIAGTSFGLTGFFMYLIVPSPSDTGFLEAFMIQAGFVGIIVWAVLFGVSVLGCHTVLNND